MNVYCCLNNHLLKTQFIIILFQGDQPWKPGRGVRPFNRSKELISLPLRRVTGRSIRSWPPVPSFPIKLFPIKQLWYKTVSQVLTCYKTLQDSNNYGISYKILSKIVRTQSCGLKKWNTIQALAVYMSMKYYIYFAAHIYMLYKPNVTYLHLDLFIYMNEKPKHLKPKII